MPPSGRPIMRLPRSRRLMILALRQRRQRNVSGDQQLERIALSAAIDWATRIHARHLVGVVARPHERPAGDLGEAERAGQSAQSVELAGGR